MYIDKKFLFSDVDEPAWIDVIVEVLLSMVFKDNFLYRVLARQVMSYLTDHVTTKSVQLLIDVSIRQSLSCEIKVYENDKELTSKTLI